MEKCPLINIISLPKERAQLEVSPFGMVNPSDYGPVSTIGL